jgi:hypothetical protein
MFTHHAHVCQLAQACVAPDTLVMHHLPGKAAMVGFALANGVTP